MSFKINWASHIVGSKFTVFALFYFESEGNFRYRWGAFIWRGLYIKGFIFGILRYSARENRLFCSKFCSDTLILLEFCSASEKIFSPSGRFYFHKLDRRSIRQKSKADFTVGNILSFGQYFGRHGLPSSGSYE